MIGVELHAAGQLVVADHDEESKPVGRGALRRKGSRRRTGRRRGWRRDRRSICGGGAGDWAAGDIQSPGGGFVSGWVVAAGASTSINVGGCSLSSLSELWDDSTFGTGPSIVPPNTGVRGERTNCRTQSASGAGVVADRSVEEAGRLIHESSGRNRGTGSSRAGET